VAIELDGGDAATDGGGIIDDDVLGPDHEVDVAIIRTARPDCAKTAGHRAIELAAADEVCVANEFGDTAVGGIEVEVARRAALEQATAEHHADLTGKAECFFLVVCHHDGGRT